MTGSGSRAGARHRPSVRVHPFLIANLVFLALALTVGGASRENPIQVGLVELAALVLLPWALVRLADLHSLRPLVWPLLIIAATVLVPIVQLVPIQPDLWMKSTAGAHTASLYQALSIKPGWHAISIAPGLTLHSALALIVPITAFLSWVTMRGSERRLGVMVILIVALLGLVLGAAQLAGGDQSLGYLYENTNYGSLVGFFSNRNHEASLLLASLPLTALLLVKADSSRLRNSMFVILGLGLILTVILALAAVQSRTGLILLGPVLLASFAIASSSGSRRFNKTALIAAGLILCALAVILPLGLGPILARFQTSFTEDLRFSVAPVIWRTAQAYLPFGSGLGSFDGVYRTVEPLNFVTYQFLNHAHDDYLELALEVGLLAVPALVLFFAWWGMQTWRVWLSRRLVDGSYAKAGWAVVTIFLAHSTLDYPLRTLALAAVFGFSCALMISAPRHE
jgi:hypothetical protein